MSEDNKQKFELLFELGNMDQNMSQAINLLHLLDESVSEVTDASVRLSNEGKLLGATFEIIDNQGKQATRTIKQLSDELLRANDAGSKFTANNKFTSLEGKFAVVGASTGMSETAAQENIKLSELQQQQNADYEKGFAKLVAIEEKRDLELNRIAGERIANEQRRDVELNQLEGQKIREYEAEAAKMIAAEEAEAQKLITIGQKRDLELYRMDAQRVAQEKALSDEVIGFEVARNAKEEQNAAKLISIQQKRDVELYQQEVRFNAELKMLMEERELAKNSSGGGIREYLSGALQTAGGMLIAQGMMELQSAFQGALHAASEFEIQMGRIQAISGVTNQTLGQMAQTIRDVSERYGMDLQSVSQGAYQALASHAANSDNLGTVSDAAAQLSTATGAQLNVTMRLLTDTMNAYNISGDQANQVSADFFKLIQTGNIDITELSQGLGNIEALSSKVGLTWSDVSASLSAMTKEGVSTAISMKLLTNLMNLALKPSKDLTEVFQTMGVDSFEAATKAFGFAGALSKINDIAKEKGLSELSKELGSWRTATGAALLTGEGFDKFQEDIKNAKGSIEVLAGSVKNALEQPGKQVEIEATKIKNFFTVEIGESIMKTLATASLAIGGVGNAIEKMTPIIISGAAAWAAYELIVAATSGTLQIKLASAAVSAIEAIEAINVAILTTPAGLAVAGAALVGFAAYTALTYRTDAENWTEISKQKIAVLESENNERKTLLKQQTALQDEAIKSQYQGVYQMVAETRALYNETGSNMTNVFKAANDTLHSIVENHVGYMKSSIKELENSIRSSEQTIKESAKFITNLNANEDKRQFRTGLEDLTDPQKLEALKKKAQELTDVGNEAYQKSLTASPDERTDLIQQYRDAFKESFDLLHEAGDIEKKDKKEVLQDQKQIKTLTEEIAKIDREMQNEDRKFDQERIKDRERLNDINDSAAQKAYDASQKFAKSKHPLKSLDAYQTSLTHDGISQNRGYQHLGESMESQDQNHARRMAEFNEKEKELYDKVNAIKDKQSEATKAVSEQHNIQSLITKELEMQRKIETDRIAAAKQEKEDAAKDLRNKQKAFQDLEQSYKAALATKFTDKGEEKLTADNFAQKMKDFQTLRNKIETGEDKAGLGSGERLNIDKALQDKADSLQTIGDKLVGEEALSKLSLKMDELSTKSIKLHDDIAKTQQEAFDNETKQLTELVHAAQSLRNTIEDDHTGIEDKAGRLQKLDQINKQIQSTDDLQRQAGIGRLQAFAANTLKTANPETNHGIEEAQYANKIETATKSYEHFLKIEQETQDKLDKYATTFPDAIKNSGSAVSKQMEDTIKDFKDALAQYEKLKAAAQFNARSEEALSARNAAALSPSDLGADASKIPDDFNNTVQATVGGAGDRSSTQNTTNVGDITVHVNGTGNTETDARQIGHAINRMIRRGQLSPMTGGR